MATAPLQIVEAPAPATWGEARKLVEKVRAGARAWLELGEVLEGLRSTYFAQTAGLRRGNSPSPHDAATEKGWQAKVREELGISDDTARRWMLDGQRYRQLLQITDGAVRQIDGQAVTAEVREKAQEALAVIQTDPSVRPARVWAGLWGASATKGKQRAAIDHARNLAMALTKLETSLPHWTKLKPEERALLEREWQRIRAALPETWQ